MRNSCPLVALFSTVLLFVVGDNICRSETASEDGQAKKTIIGTWRADSVTLMSANNTKKTLPQLDRKPFSITVSKETMIMRVGDQKFAEMSYVLDEKQTPKSIDVKYQDQDLSGIYELDGDKLKISLNDAKKDRPKDFTSAENYMELVLHRFKGEPLMMINADGTDLHTLTSMPEYTSCGSPNWSHDGKKIVFDSWRSVYGENYEQSHIFVINPDGTSPKDLGDGTLPSWSPDGKKIAFSRYSPYSGIWIMNADGSDITNLNTNGYCADWSPKNNEVAFTLYTGSYWNICVINLTTKESRILFEQNNLNADSVIGIEGGLSWSPDGQWICLKARSPDGTFKLALVNAQGQSKGFKVLLPNKEIKGVKDFNHYFSWSPDGKQLLVPVMMEGDANLQLYFFDPEGKNQPQKLAGQNPSVRSYGSAWSEDGKKIVFSFWPGNSGQNILLYDFSR